MQHNNFKKDMELLAEAYNVVSESAKKCWDGYHKDPSKKRSEQGSCVKVEDAEDKHKASNPGILSNQIKGKVTCSKAKSLRSSIKDKGSNTAKAAQRFINYHDCDEEEWSNEEAEEKLAGLPEEDAEYRGRKVTLNKPTRGDVKKFKVYVKDPKTGNVKKVNFGHGGTSAKRRGEKTMKIRKSNPKARKSFRARHNCDNPGPKTKARYWSCKKW